MKTLENTDREDDVSAGAEGADTETDVGARVFVGSDAGASLIADVVIVAAGRGTRAGDGPAKQYRKIAGKPLLARSIEAAAASQSVGRVLVVISPGAEAEYGAAITDLSARAASKLLPPAHGGAERAASVLAGLEALIAHRPPARVLIHDAARPFASATLFDRVTAALEHTPGACAALRVVDALRREDDEGRCGDMVPRDGLWRAQTPQGFEFDVILAAHREANRAKAVDDAEIATQSGAPVLLIEGEIENFKVTTPEDFARAERLARWRDGMAIGKRTVVGQGFDVHAFGPGDHLMLCGVRVPHDKGFTAHSDGDVALHALCDAIYGALAEGDIGRRFPPSGPQWKGASSDIFLADARDLTAKKGGEINNIDLTILCEKPKITPHSEAMRVRIAEVLQIPKGRVSVKATTTERLGFPGREEGIAAMATASISLPLEGAE